LEGRIILIHQHLCDDRCSAFFDAALVIFVLQRLLELISDRALGVRAADV
jgi:hypothetical protein